MDTKFCYNERVRVKTGFFKNCVGTVTEHYSNEEFRFLKDSIKTENYYVQLDSFPILKDQNGNEYRHRQRFLEEELELL